MTKHIAYFAQSTVLFTNHTVLLLFKELGYKNIRVHLFCPVDARLPDDISNVTMHPIPNHMLRWPKNPVNLIRACAGYIQALLILRKYRIKICYAQDHMPLAIVYRLNKLLAFTRFIYVSFEIYTLDECLSRYEKRIKTREIRHCRQVTDILVQDEKRKKLLEEENSIQNNVTWHLVPIANAPDAMIPPLKTGPKDQIQIIHSGHVEPWSGFDIIIRSIEMRVPVGCRYTIHSFNPFSDHNPVHRKLKKLQEEGYPVTLLHHRYEDETEYYRFLQQYDVGLALYVPLPKIGHSHNIEEIGLSSGKFANYILLNIPVITTANSYYPELLKTYKYGWIIYESLGEITDISGYTDIKHGARLAALYNDVLNPIPHIRRLVQNIHAEAY